jgi:Dolichyl-phosphate-mannose-protein mannosyltransferase
MTARGAPLPVSSESATNAPTARNNGLARSLHPAIVALVVIALGGWLLRAFPYLRSGGASGLLVDYDEGVYFSASALLGRGVLPYRDFFHAHPPGLEIFFLPITAWLSGGHHDPSSAFGVARWSVTLIGVANIVLLGRLATRAWGTTAGLFAALLYATQAEVVAVERGVHIEPLLNLAVLAAATVWLSARNNNNRSVWRPFAAGLLCGFAVSMKVFGLFAVAAALFSAPKRRRWLEIRAFLGGLVVGTALLCGPLFVLAPKSFISDVVVFNARRNGEGTAGGLRRVIELFGLPHSAVIGTAPLETLRFLAPSALAVLGLVLAARKLRDPNNRIERFAVSLYLVTFAACLASGPYYANYNAYLAVGGALLGGYGAALVLRSVWARRRAAVTLVAALALVLIPAISLRRSIIEGNQDALPVTLPRAAEHVPLVELGKTIRGTVPPHECVFAIQPEDAIAGGRLPPVHRRTPTVVDAFGVVESEHLAASAPGASDDRSQAILRQAMGSCRFVSLDFFGRILLSSETRQWFLARFRKIYPNSNDAILGEHDLWERRSNAPTLAGGIREHMGANSPKRRAAHRFLQSRFRARSAAKW